MPFGLFFSNLSIGKQHIDIGVVFRYLLKPGKITDIEPTISCVAIIKSIVLDNCN